MSVSSAICFPALEVHVKVLTWLGESARRSLLQISKRSHVTANEVQRDHHGPVQWDVSSQPRSMHSANWSSLISSRLPRGGISRALHDETRVHALLSANLSKGTFHKQCP